MEIASAPPIDIGDISRRDAEAADDEPGKAAPGMRRGEDAAREISSPGCEMCGNGFWAFSPAQAKIIARGERLPQGLQHSGQDLRPSERNSNFR